MNPPVGRLHHQRLISSRGSLQADARDGERKKVVPVCERQGQNGGTGLVQSAATSPLSICSVLGHNPNRIGASLEVGERQEVGIHLNEEGREQVYGCSRAIDQRSGWEGSTSGGGGLRLRSVCSSSKVLFMPLLTKGQERKGQKVDCRQSPLKKSRTREVHLEKASRQRADGT